MGILYVIYSLQGVASSSKKLLQLKQHVATIFLQWSSRNSLFTIVYLLC